MILRPTHIQSLLLERVFKGSSKGGHSNREKTRSVSVIFPRWSLQNRLVLSTGTRLVTYSKVVSGDSDLRIVLTFLLIYLVIVLKISMNLKFLFCFILLFERTLYMFRREHAHLHYISDSSNLFSRS